MPIANADTIATPQATPVTIAVLGNDDGAGLSITGFTQPGAGSLVLNPDGSFTYTPAAGFSGSDGFTYTVRDAAGATATAMVTVTVARPNAAPRAEADVAQVTAGESIVVPVLANDVDPEDDQLTLLLVEAPGHGTVQVEPGGDRLRYTPQVGFVGTDSFTYTVGDGQGGLATGSVTVAVTTASTPPALVPDRVVTAVAEPVTVDVLANDQDPEGEVLTLTGVTLPAHGTLALTAEQRFVYTPAPGFEGEDGFTYTVRDSAGLRATGTVAITVERRNTPPVGAPDAATSVGGVPVRLDLLANDNDPEGDPLRLTALELPAGGQITVNPDQSVTYTPKTGFSGTDRFTYTVGDGAAEATVEATVEVLPAAGVTFANGYRYRRRLVVPAINGAGGAVVADVVLLVRETGDWLRGVIAGGRLESAAGFDLRFELADSTRLDHETERYDATAGEVVAWVRLPSWRLSEVLELALYYGKPGLTAPEAAPAATWRGYLAAWDARTGADRTGRGRALVPTNVGAGELIGGCGRFDGNAVARRTDASFLAGLDALTVQAVVRADAAMLGSGHGILAQGPMAGDPAAAGLGLSYLARSPDGATRVIAFALRCADGDMQAVSAADAQAAGPQALHATWRRGAAPVVFADGVPGPAGGPVRAGTTAPPAGGIFVGAGPGDTASGGWQGLIDEVRLRDEALPTAWIAFEGRNLLAPAATYGMGGEDAAVDALAAPVALPVTARLTVGGHLDVDPLSSVLAPDGYGLALVAFDQPGDGRATVVDGRIRYTPRAGFVGRDRFTYTVSGGGKRSTGLITVDVAPPVTQAVDDAVSTAADQPITIDVLANDLGEGLSLLEVEAPAHGSAAIIGRTVTYRPEAGFTGADSFAYRIGSPLGESRATVSVTVTESDPNLPYAYIHKPAEGLLPASDDDIVVWNVPAAGGTCPHVGNAGQVLLMVAPSGPVRGSVSATNLQFKAVFLIGATLRPQGITSLMTQTGTWVRGGDVLRIGFAAGIAVRPVLFLANIDYDSRNAVEPNLFGGFLQAGTSRPSAGPADPDGSANRERWVDVYLQKIRVAHGSYSFTATGSAASAFFQPRTGGVGDIRCGQLDLRWHGAAFNLASQPPPRDTVKADARLSLNRVAIHAMPPAPATADPLPAPVLFQLLGGTAEPVSVQLERGNYQATLFDGVELERYPADGGTLDAYFVPSAAPDGATLRFDSVGRRLSFPAFRAAGRLHPTWTGEVGVAEAAARATVTSAEIGAGVRVATVQRLREILMPRLELRAVDDAARTSRGEAVTIDLLGNDVGAAGGVVTLGEPAQGSASLTADNRARYVPAAGFTGPDSFTYTVSHGGRSSTATVRVEVSGATVGAWGTGPRSGERWWSGFGDVTAGSLGIVAAFERMRSRPVDIIAAWAPKNQITSWDDLAGGPGDDASRITGTLTLGVNNKRVIWDHAPTRALPVHLNLTLVPPSASNRNGNNPGVWWDYAAGEFDVYWRRLGRRMAFLDDLVDRTAPLVLDLGWEHSGPWYHWSIAGTRAGAPAYTQFPYAFARIVAAIREGYYGHASRNCPYKFCWRPARVTAAAGVHHSAFYPGDEVVDLIGMSHHERDPYLTPSNWTSRTQPWPGRRSFIREGWDPFFDFCANRGKQACFPEWGPIEHHPEYEPSSHPEEFFRLTRSYIEARLPLFAYECYFNGDEAKLTANADWAGTREYRNLWGRPA